MKARVKATGEIVDVGIDYNQDADFITLNGQLYWQGELDFINLNTKDMREETLIDAINDIDNLRCMVEDIREAVCAEPDYWEKLKHQYAGMAMQGMLSNHVFFKDVDHVTNGKPEDMVTAIASSLATALVEKLKEGK